MKQRVADLIFRLRSDHGLTQDDFSNRIFNISRRHYRRIESGEMEVSLKQFLLLVLHFDLNSEEIIAELIADDNYFPHINELYQLLKEPYNNMDEIAITIQELKKRGHMDNYFMSEYHRKTINMIDSFYQYKRDNNRQHLIDFIDNNLDFSSDNLRMYSLIFPTSNCETIHSLLPKIIKKHNNSSKDDLYVQTVVILNGIGNLLEKCDDQTATILTYLEQVHEKIVTGQSFQLLPIYYRHLAKCYQMMGNVDKVQKYKQKALDLAREFHNHVAIQEIMNEFQ